MEGRQWTGAYGLCDHYCNCVGHYHLCFHRLFPWHLHQSRTEKIHLLQVPSPLVQVAITGHAEGPGPGFPGYSARHAHHAAAGAGRRAGIGSIHRRHHCRRDHVHPGPAYKPSDRIKIFAAGLCLFALGAILNGILFNQLGVILFILLLLIAKPLLDLAYFPIQFKVIDIVSKIEKRGEFAYILNHEAGLYVGRFIGAGTFLLLAYGISTEIALRYAIVIIALLQLCSIWVAKRSSPKAKL